MYAEDEFDLAGFSLGIVENSLMLPRVSDLRPGDVVIGLPSNGLHSNGFSLVHKVVELAGVKFTDPAPFSAYEKTYGLFIIIFKEN